MTSDKQQEGLDFEKAKELTVEEAVQKEAELKAGITDDDDVLDKYIKRHRTEVASQKFDGTTTVTSQKKGDTAPLDEFIDQQRQLFEEKLETSEAISEQPLLNNESESSSQTNQIGSEESNDLDRTLVFEPSPLVPPVSEKNEQEVPLEREERFPKQSSVEQTEDTDAITHQPNLSENEEADRKLGKKSRKVLWYSMACVALLGVATAAWYTTQGTNKKTSTTTNTSSNSVGAKKNNTSFNQMYQAFFTDDSQTKLKNAQFDQLAQLKKALNKLQNTSYYTSAKKKFDSLNRQIKAIQAVNALFQSDAINDGVKTGAKVKSDANFDGLSSDSLNTGNATLDKLLQEVIADGRSQLMTTSTSQDTGTTNVVAGDTTQNSAATNSATDTSTNSDTSSASVPINSVSAATPYGIQSYDESTLQKNLSRVPINESAIADTTNSAWDWTPGVLEKIVATSQERGYITGNNYILQKVNIINGNGYYNMYKPDGTYLFSINCKTGYFVGNAAGHSDALDY